MILLTRSFLFLLLFIPISNTFGQGKNAVNFIQDLATGIEIAGIVLEMETGKPLEFATVSIFQLPDSSLAEGNVTNIEGKFSIELKPGHYFGKIDYLAFNTAIIPEFRLEKSAGKVDLGVFQMQQAAAALEEVVVTAEKSQMQLSLDKRVFNVGKDLASRGGNAADLLDNVPSVQVDVEGNVSLRGSQNVRILINGRPSGLVGLSNTNGLQQLQANMIDRVEVITNPSARYEAEGMAGIINIILKKEQRSGLNGSFDFTAGYPDNYGTSINLNYRTNKLNLFANYGITYRNGPGSGSLYQEVYAGDTTFITRQSNERLRGGIANNIRFGTDYFINEKNILTGAYTLRLENDQNRSETLYRDFINNLSSPTGNTIRTDDEKEEENNQELSLTYKHLFEKKDHEFSLDVRFQDNLETEGSDLRNRYFTSAMDPASTEDLVQRSNNSERQQQLILQGDYSFPFHQEGKIEAGFRSSFRDITNDFLVEEYGNDSWQALNGLSNDFLYDENIHAAYFIYGDKKGKFSWQIGLRPEYSQVRTRLIQTNEINDRDYLNLFPSAHFNMELPGQNSFQISYSRRVSRPGFWDLNPFFTFSDDRNFFSGNPNLDPEFTNAFELGHLKYWENASLSSSIYYRQTDGVISRIRRVNADGNSITMPENLLTEDAFGLEFTGSWDIFKWWKLNGDFNFFRAITDGGNIGETFQADTYTWFTRGTSRITFWKNTDFQARFNYRAPQENTQGTTKAFYSVDLALSKDILKEKGTITLSVRDLLNSRRRRYTSFGENFFSEGDFQWRARQFLATFTYRLNQKKQWGDKSGRSGGFGGEGME